MFAGVGRGRVSKVMLGLILGGALGLLDGLSALLYPGAASMIVPIVVGSTVKGLVTGLAISVLAQKLQSSFAGVVVGLAIGLALSYLAALTPIPRVATTTWK